MNDLIFSCTEDLLQPTTPVCATDYGERVVQIIIGEQFQSTIPAASDFTNAYDNGDITIINGISNGHKVFVGDTEIEGLYGKERWDAIYRVEANLRRIDENIVRMCEILTRTQGLSMWYVTDKDYMFGGAEGYIGNPYFSEVIKEGVGNPPHIQFEMEYYATGADYGVHDQNYNDVEITGVITYPGAGEITYPGAGEIIYP